MQAYKRKIDYTCQFSLLLLSSVQFIISIKITKSINNTKIIQNHKHRVEEMLQKAKAVLVIAPSYKENTEKQNKTRRYKTRQVRKPDRGEKNTVFVQFSWSFYNIKGVKKYKKKK